MLIKLRAEEDAYTVTVGLKLRPGVGKYLLHKLQVLNAISPALARDLGFFLLPLYMIIYNYVWNRFGG